MLEVLLVDDAEDTLKILSECLHMLSKELHITTADRGETALEILNTERIDIVVTDLSMPGRVDGYALLLQLQQTHPNLPVIVHSAGSHTSNRLKGLRFAQFIEKPSSLNEILRAILAHGRTRRVDGDTRRPGPGTTAARAEESDGVHAAGPELQHERTQACNVIKQ